MSGFALGGGPISQCQAPIVQTMFERCLPNCRAEVDACLASCPISSIRADGGKLDAKEALGCDEIVVCNMQGPPSGFQSGDSSDHNRVLSVTFLGRLLIGSSQAANIPASSGGMAILVIADNPRRVLRTEFALLLNRFRKTRLTRSLKFSVHFA
jgi:hypothetical protein